MEKRIGRCKWCRRSDATLYVQAKETHNEECDSCHPLYAAILAHPRRDKFKKGAGRKALLAALAEIAKVGDVEVVTADGEAERVIVEKLETHPARRSGNVGKALLAIRRIIR